MKLHGKELQNNDLRKLTNSPNFRRSHSIILFTNQWPKEGGEIKQKQNAHCLLKINWSKWDEWDKIKKIQRQHHQETIRAKPTPNTYKNKGQKVSESKKIRKPVYHIIIEPTNLQCRNGRSQNRTKTCNCWEGWDRTRSALPGSRCSCRSYRIEKSSSRSSLTPSSTTSKKNNNRKPQINPKKSFWNLFPSQGLRGKQRAIRFVSLRDLSLAREGGGEKVWGVLRN